MDGGLLVDKRAGELCVELQHGVELPETLSGIPLPFIPHTPPADVSLQPEPQGGSGTFLHAVHDSNLLLPCSKSSIRADWLCLNQLFLYF